MARTAAVKKDPITGAPMANTAKPVTMSRLKQATKMAVKSAEKQATASSRMAAKIAEVLAEPKAPAAKKAPKEKAYVPPKNLAVCGDEYYRIRNERLALAKQVAALEAKESACREYLINFLPKSQASGVAGKLCRVAVENKAVPQVTDWSVEKGVWGYVLKNIKKNPGITGMFQRRVNDAMVKEIWESGKEIPGISKLDVPVLRVNKL